MNKKDIDKRKSEFVYCYYLGKYVEENRTKFNNIFMDQIYKKILTDDKLVLEFTDFLAQKMFLLAFDTNEIKMIKEVFISELN